MGERHAAGVVGHVGVEEEGSSGRPSQRARGPPGSGGGVGHPEYGAAVTLAHVVGETDVTETVDYESVGCERVETIRLRGQI